MHWEASLVHGMDITGVWTDTTTNITSLDFVASQTNGIQSGSVISLYRLKR